jgi:hypothetical protein
VATGAAADVDVAIRLGGVAAIIGAGALAVYAARAWRTRGRWTTDAGWHVFAMGGLISAIGWFVAGIATGAGRLVVHGTSPEAWSILASGGPLVAGWMGLAVVASATHLVPAVGPGDQAAHARQRQVLGRVPWLRLTAIDLGVAALSVGLAIGNEPLAVAGTVATAAGLGASAALLAAAVVIGLRPR